MRENDKLYLVSIIIPMYNEQQHILRCLTSVIEQNYPHKYLEILVIDGYSDDDSRQLVLDFARHHPVISISLLHNPKRIIPAALNIGIRAAKGDIIIRVDGHTTIAPDYVNMCVRYLVEGRADNVGGLMRPVGTAYVAHSIAMATSSPFGIGGSRFHYSEQEQYVDTVYLGAYWRKTFDEIGLYDETFHINEDYELNYRLRKAGGRVLLSPAIKSTYTPRSSLSGLWRQYFKYGYWKVRTLQKHPASLQWRQVVSPAFVCALLGSLLLSFFWRPASWLFMLVAGCYLLANLVASTISAARGSWRYLIILPLAFATIHIAWGIGFCYGMVLAIVNTGHQR